MIGYSTVEWLPMVMIAVAAVAYVIREGLELSGRSPGASLLRVENADLIRRNHELEAKVGRLETVVGEMRTKIRDLELTNQAAVLAALVKHEEGARERHASISGLLAEIAANTLPPVHTTQTTGNG